MDSTTDHSPVPLLLFFLFPCFFGLADNQVLSLSVKRSIAGAQMAYAKSLDQRLFEALTGNHGLLLSAQDVEDMLLIDDAIGTRVSNAAASEAGHPVARDAEHVRVFWEIMNALFYCTGILGLLFFLLIVHQKWEDAPVPQDCGLFHKRNFMLLFLSNTLGFASLGGIVYAVHA